MVDFGDILLCVKSKNLLVAATGVFKSRQQAIFGVLLLALTGASAAEPTATPMRQPPCEAGSASCGPSPGLAQPLIISYSQALQSALQASLAAETQRLEQELQDAQWQSVQADYLPKPSLSGSSLWPSSSPGGAAHSTSSLTSGANWQLKTGTRLQAQWQQSLDRASRNTNPQQSTLMLELIQPLLRGAGAAARYPLDIARLTDSVGRYVREQALDNIFTTVSQAFFDAVVAQQQVELAQRSLERVVETKNMNYALFQAGQTAQVELLQSDADVSQTELSLVRTRNAATASVNNLLQLLGPEWAERRASSVKVTDKLPEMPVEAIPTDPDALFGAAEAARADFRVAQVALEIARISVAKAADERLPSVDLRLGVASTYSSFSSEASRQSSVGVNWVLPIDRTPLKLQQTQARIELQRAQLSLKAATRQLHSEVTSALRELEFVKAQQVLAVKNTDLVRRKLDAETSRFRVGRGSGFQLSAAQNELTLAENAEIEASLAIQRSLLEFHRANGTLALKRMSVLGRP